jgi:type II secretory pathway predicted ATPase ExeA
MSFRDAGNSRHDLAGRAVAALETVMRDEGGLQRVEGVTVGKAFDRRDGCAVLHDRERQTGVHAFAVEKHRAGATGTLVTALLRAGQIKPLAEQV